MDDPIVGMLFAGLAVGVGVTFVLVIMRPIVERGFDALDRWKEQVEAEADELEPEDLGRK